MRLPRPTNAKLQELHGKNLARLKALKVAIDELAERLKAEARIAAHAAAVSETIADSVARQTQILIAHSGEIAAINLRLSDVERKAFATIVLLERLTKPPVPATPAPETEPPEGRHQP
jgi:hypothetical protein